MSEEIFRQSYDREKFDKLRITSDCTRRYTVEFESIGAKVEFVMLAGQSFVVTGNQSDIKVTIDDVEPDVPGGGLQLVPAVPRAGGSDGGA